MESSHSRLFTQQKPVNPSNSTEIVLLPYLHPMMDLQYVDDNGMLLSEDKFSTIQKAVEVRDKTPGKLPSFEAETDLSKSDLTNFVLTKRDMSVALETEFNRNIITVGGEPYVIYPKFAIGKGAYGKVIAGQNQKGEYVALKKISSQEDAKREHATISMLSESPMGSPVFIKRNSKSVEKTKSSESPISTPPDSPSNQSKPREKYIIAMHLKDGLSARVYFYNKQFDFLKATGFTSYNHIAPIIRIQLAINVFDELIRLHEKEYTDPQTQKKKKGFVHRDLKDANVVMNPLELMAKIVDFGSTVPLDENGKFYDSSAPGTLDYMALKLRSVMQDMIYPKQEKTDNNNDKPPFEYDITTDGYALGIFLANLFYLYDQGDLPDPYKGEGKENGLVQWGKKTFVVDEEHIYFKSNNIFPKNTDFLQKILNEIRLLTSEIPYDLTALYAGRQVLEEMKQELLKNHKTHVWDRVAIVKVSDLLDPNTDFDKTLAEIVTPSGRVGFTHLVLIDNPENGYTTKDYLSLIQRIETHPTHSILVNRRVFKNPRENLAALDASRYLRTRILSEEKPFKTVDGKKVVDEQAAPVKQFVPFFPQQVMPVQKQLIQQNSNTRP